MAGAVVDIIEAMWQWAAWAVVAYLCGSIPFALLIGKAHGIDLRTIGSGNLGATNVTRAVGRGWGRLCLALDALKGFVPVTAAGVAMGTWGDLQLNVPPALAWAWLAVAAAAVIGHVFPVWLGFRGGKGVATSLGVLLAVFPQLAVPGLLTGLTWLVVSRVWRYASVASVTAAALLPVYLLMGAAVSGRLDQRVVPFLVVACLLAGLVIWRHRGNLARLRAGQELPLHAATEAKNDPPPAAKRPGNDPPPT